MKHCVCLLLVVSIAYSGCTDKKPNQMQWVDTSFGWIGGLERVSELRRRIEDLDRGLNEVKSSTEPNKALVVRMDELEAALESQRAEESAEEALLVRIDKLEAAIESHRAEIENWKNAYRLYEIAIESQRAAIESLEKLCRMYEDQIQSQREAIKD